MNGVYGPLGLSSTGVQATQSALQRDRISLATQMEASRYDKVAVESLRFRSGLPEGCHVSRQEFAPISARWVQRYAPEYLYSLLLQKLPDPLGHGLPVGHVV